MDAADKVPLVATHIPIEVPSKVFPVEPVNIEVTAKG